MRDKVSFRKIEGCATRPWRNASCRSCWLAAGIVSEESLKDGENGFGAQLCSQVLIHY
jgi:hypothetical protein